MVETSKAYEDALEAEVEDLGKKNNQLKNENDKIRMCLAETRVNKIEISLRNNVYQRAKIFFYFIIYQERLESQTKRLEKQVEKYKNDKYDIEDSMKA